MLMEKLVSGLNRLISALQDRLTIRPERPKLNSIWTRQVYELVARMPDITMVTPPNPQNMPIGAFEYERSSYKFEIHMVSVNGMGGVDCDMMYDTSVDELTAMSRWHIPEATMDQINDWNKARRSSYAVKSGEFVEITNSTYLLCAKADTNALVNDMVFNITVDTNNFVKYMMSLR